MPSRIRAHRILEQSCHTPPQGVKIISSNRVYESTCITGHSYSAPESQEVVRTEFHDTDMFSYKGLSNMVPASAEKRCDRIKALLWEPDGFVLLYKCMGVQGRFRRLRSQLEVKQLTSESTVNPQT